MSAVTPTVDDPTTWVPQGVTSLDLLNDAVNLMATILAALGYGIVFTLYCICARSLYNQLSRKELRRQNLFMLAYITILAILGLLYVISVSRVAQLAYVNFRNFPEGPFAYTLVTYNSPDNILGSCMAIMTTWFTDAILIWRVYVLYSSKRYPWLAIAIPCLLYAANLALGMVILYIGSIPSESFFSSMALPFGTSFYSLTAALTALSTVLMTVRLMMARRQYIKSMGNSSHAQQYLSIATMLIESSALYGLWSIVFIALYAVNNPIQQIFLGTLGDVAIIALLLIIYRVSEGKAWKSNTEKVFTSIDWRTDSSPSKTSTGRYIKPTFTSQTESGTLRFDESITATHASVEMDRKKGGSIV